MNLKNEINSFSPDESDNIKVPCHYCGVEILKDTAKRTNGYCMPHSYYGLSFVEIIGGEFEIISEHTQLEVEKTLSKENKNKFEVIKTLMIAGDKLVKFRTKPFNNQEEYAKNGYAIYRENVIYIGFVTKWAINPKFREDVETEVSIEEIKEVFGKDWEEVKNKVLEGDKFVHFISSPFTWDCLAGREYYCVKRGEDYLYTILVKLN